MLGKAMSGSKHHWHDNYLWEQDLARLIGTSCYWANESVSRDLTIVSWQVDRICGFNISSNSGSSSDIHVDTLAVLRSLDSDDDEDPNDVLDDVRI
jgi:hypothetical protein